MKKTQITHRMLFHGEGLHRVALAMHASANTASMLADDDALVVNSKQILGSEDLFPKVFEGVTNQSA